MKHKLLKLCTVVLTCLVTMASVSAAIPVSAASSQQNIVVMLESKEIKFPDQKPVVQNNRTLVPIRFVAEALGYRVEWNAKDNSAVIDGGRIVLYIGTNRAVIDGKKVTLETKSTVMNERTMVPLRVVAETLGCTVDWIADTQTVLVNRRNANGTEKSLFERFKQTGLFWDFKTTENEYLVRKSEFKTLDKAKNAGYMKFWIERPLNKEELLNQSFDCSICVKAFTAEELKAAKNLLITAYPTGYEKVYDIMLKSIKGELWETFCSYDSALYPLYSALPPRSGTYGTTYYDNREVEMYVNDTCTLLTINLSESGYVNPEVPRTLSKEELTGYTALAKQYYCLELWGLK